MTVSILSNPASASYAPVVAPEPTVSVLVARRLLQTIEREGGSSALVLERAAIEVQRLDRPFARITRPEMDRLTEAALDFLGDEAFGLHYGEAMRQSTFNPLSNLVTHAASMRQGFAAIARFSALLTDESPCHLVEHGDEVVVVCTTGSVGSARVRRFSAEVTVLGFLHFVRCFSPDAMPRRVTFDYPAPAYRAEYARLFDGAERFDQPCVSLVLDRSLLDLPSLFEDGAIYDALRTMIEERMASLARHLPYALRIRDFLVREGFPHRTDMATVARWLGLSVRSLRRRLVAEDKRFDEIVGEAHGDIAKRLILSNERSIQEVAYDMGFASVSAFHRAFKRWTGVTPSEYRRTHAG